ncbi:DUF3489 domain-containing protein [Pseudoroseicyclus tamaricis]|uniref:DUF3489 domain-containing protein n=1 Tax=Pseudoroseicyclus tamaricis TaxID=2705421 RepID=A0A6B2K105_9RHOB|nr:DUF3489 domain-containing protein [Pseudoroseicyclus tamaricis]
MTKSPENQETRVRKLLERKQGASLESICMATGWQQHSARLSLSGLRKTGSQSSGR